MNDLKKFKVIPNVPEKLNGLYDIAHNLWLTWNSDAIKLFIKMDSDLWKRTNQNPIRMLSEINQNRLDELANEKGFIIELERVKQRLEDYMNRVIYIDGSRECCIGYFSLEYGLTESLSIYSGGLGVLSGDHIKSSSDLGLNLNGVGLLYQMGYFQQYLNQDGWQLDFYKQNDFFDMRVKEVKNEDGTPIEIELEFPGRKIYLKIWKLIIGRVNIYLLDSNIEKNIEYDRKLTAQLYGGDKELRMQQEIILGLGGVRLFERLGFSPDVIHLNEGHSCFAIFERARMLMEKYSFNFDESIEISKETSVFTTHTSVPAGNDEFEPGLITKYFNEYVKKLGISIDRFLDFGRINPKNKSEHFSMTVAAIRNSSYINGVSKLHSKVSKKIWKNIWGEIPEEHIPISSVTNGIHVPSWLSFEMGELFEKYLGENWEQKQDIKDLWNKIKDIPDIELWNVHKLRRKKLVNFVRRRFKKQFAKKRALFLINDKALEVLNPEILTIGFARRFATYKRGDLILRDPDRLLKILNNTDKPVQVVFAGKAHPKDNEGKDIIKNIIHFINSNNLVNKFVFIENYDINVARYMVQGVDVWLNNPLRPLEACGTSGMKAGANGVLNFSVLDGWWNEAYINTIGWSIGNGEVYESRKYQDDVDSKSIYSILENEIIPLFYERDSDGLPIEWINMMKNSIISIASYYNTHRMVKDYFNIFYKKAGERFKIFKQDNFTYLKEFIKWKNCIKNNFNSINIERVNFDDKRVYTINSKFKVEVNVFLGNIKPDYVNIDVYYGRISDKDEIKDSKVVNLKDVKELGNNRYKFSGYMLCNKTGNFGFKIRVTPSHPLIVNPYEMNLKIWK